MEEFVGGVGREREERVVDGDANALLALTDTERAAEFDLVFEIVFCDEILQLLHNLS